MWRLQGFHKYRWWHLTGFWVTIVSFETDDEAKKFSEEYNSDPYSGFEVRTRLVFLVDKMVQKEIKLQREKYESNEAMINRIMSDDRPSQRGEGSFRQ
jgi:hypothetical protein